MNYPLEIFFASFIRIAQIKSWDALQKKLFEFRFKYGIRKAKPNENIIKNYKHCNWQNFLKTLINIADECKEFDLQVTLQEYLEELEDDYKRRFKNSRKT